jgi:hypothetical protein
MNRALQKIVFDKNKLDIYYDFTKNLILCIIKYYLDDETLASNKDITNHYNWCYNKICNEFKEEDIDFTNNSELREYFFSLYKTNFYKSSKRNNDLIYSEAYFLKFWKNIFILNSDIRNVNINVLVELYLIFDKSINKKCDKFKEITC